MSKRNFILLIIILVLAVAGYFGFLYLNQPKTTPTGEESVDTNFFSQFNPFKKPTTTPPVVTPPAIITEEQPPVVVPATKLTKISSMPIAGFTVFMKERLKEVPVVAPAVTPADTTATPAPATTPTSTTTAKKTTKPTPPPTEFILAVRYVAKATGNIYQTFIDKIEERQFSNTIIPKVYDSYFGNNGESVIMRYLKTDGRTIETFVANLPKELLGGDTTGSNEIKGTFLPNNVKDISLSPDTSKIFYLFENAGNMIGTTLSFKDNKKVQIFNSPFTEWLSWWGSDKTITLSTKPSFNMPGYVYKMDLAGKNLTRVLGNVNGLTTLMGGDGKQILFSDDKLTLNIFHIDTGISDSLGIRGMPEKCVWNKIGDTIYCAVPKLISGINYPDAWYQGETSFNDQIWKINTKTGNATLLADPALMQDGEEIDGIKLAVDEGANYLFFVNKKDSILWKLDLK